MKLKKLEIVGFKSFVDRTVLKFDHDVTGIVGPNGCGKSNIVDAIRWCMGEQSAKHLRGKSMDDVIFNGSESRGPGGLAEVTLTFENNDGLAPIEYRDYPEIAITRRLDRDGNSDYLINKTQVRLKDVTDLFLGTGAGTKAYSIIEQGKVGLIVSSKPEDRRLLIEEAAGITKYKSKRKQAERKMELTQQNLLRVGDIITELEKSLASLKRQAQKADRYLAYRQELDDLVLHEASHKYLGIVAMQKYAADALDEHTREADERRNALVTRETELETLRLSALEAEHVLEVAQTAHFQADNEVRALEGEIARAKDQLEIIKVREVSATRELEDVTAERQALRGEQERFTADLEVQIQEEESAAEALLVEEERLQEVTARQQESERRLADLRRRASEIMSRIARAETSLGAFDRRKNEVEARREKLYGEREDLEGKQLELVARADELRRNVDDLKSGKTSSKDERETLEKRLVELKSGVGESEKNLEQNKGDLHKARSRMQALLEVQSRLEGVGAGTKAVIHRRDPGVLGMLADLVEPPAHLTQALAAAMGDHLQTLIVTDESKAIELARWLRDEKKGRAVFLPRTGRHIGDARPALPALGDDSLGYFSDLVRFCAEDEEIVRAVLGDVIVAKDFEAAHRIANALDHRPHAIVTLDGEVLHADGRIAAGQKEQLAAGMLDSKRETRELSEVVTRLDALVTELVAKHQALRAAISETQTGLDAARQAEHRGEIALVGAEKDLRNAESELGRTRSRLEQVVGEIQDLAERIAEADQEQSTARADLETAYLDKASIDSEGEDAQRDADSHREELEARRQVTTDKKIQVARAKEKTRSIEGALERLTRTAQELESRSGRLRDELVAGAERQSELGEFLGDSRDRLEGSIENAHNRKEALTEAKVKHEEARAAMSAHEGELKALRAAADQSEKARMQQEMKLRELMIEMRNLLESVAEKYRGLELPRIVGDYHLRDIPGEEHRARIHELQGAIDRLGSVNLDAKREYEEGEGRFKVIAEQKLDLEKALADLTKAIEQMDRESKRLFKETFDAVNERFQQLFPKMFRGGKAHLVMTNPDDLLETGIDIVAQPPGKKIGNIELMSGGEKALTAVSLIFAMFQIRPSPFCILDEVDAPLDEANVARYNEAIRTMTDRSQFILITHIKRTMQMVDVLYGVTMPEPGVSMLTSVDLTTVDKKISRPSHSAVA